MRERDFRLNLALVTKKDKTGGRGPNKADMPLLANFIQGGITPF